MGPHLSRFWTHGTWGIKHFRLRWVHASQTVWTHGAEEYLIFDIVNPHSSSSTNISPSLWILHPAIFSSSSFAPRKESSRSLFRIIRIIRIIYVGIAVDIRSFLQYAAGIEGVGYPVNDLGPGHHDAGRIQVVPLAA